MLEFTNHLVNIKLFDLFQEDYNFSLFTNHLVNIKPTIHCFNGRKDIKIYKPLS